MVAQNTPLLVCCCGSKIIDVVCRKLGWGRPVGHACTALCHVLDAMLAEAEQLYVTETGLLFASSDAGLATAA
jgi:hypothetical protein